MELIELRLANVRNIESAELAFAGGVSEFIGDNGAGKTSVLEAVFMLSHGRSFRSVKRESLIRFGAPALDVFARVRAAGGEGRLGLSRKPGDWEARVDGQRLHSLAELLSRFAVVCFEPGSHALISGPADERRSFVDWALFHVEPSYLDVARRYRRALKQRNSLLRSAGPKTDLDSWDAELARSGSELDVWRSDYLDNLSAHVEALSEVLVPELGTPILRYARGWPADLALGDALLQRRARDLERGHTGLGPHRADWRISFERAPEREHLSRGQEKLCALACLLAQAALFNVHKNEWPVLCLDDLASELDASHQRSVLNWLIASGAQVLITGVSPLRGLADLAVSHRKFHVEQGRVTRLL